METRAKEIASMSLYALLMLAGSIILSIVMTIIVDDAPTKYAAAMALALSLAIFYSVYFVFYVGQIIKDERIIALLSEQVGKVEDSELQSRFDSLVKEYDSRHNSFTLKKFPWTIDIMIN